MSPSMTDRNTDVIQGTLDMLILKTLSLEPMHGFGIAHRVEQVSRNVFKVNPGSLLTALQRLERAGWLDAEWRQTCELTSSEVLYPHTGREKAAGKRDRGLDAPRHCDRKIAENRRLTHVTLATIGLRTS